MNAQGHRCEAHSFKRLKALPWPVCTGCGLVLLKNAFTGWAARIGCCNASHPEHEAQRRRSAE